MQLLNLTLISNLCHLDVAIFSLCLLCFHPILLVFSVGLELVQHPLGFPVSVVEMPDRFGPLVLGQLSIHLGLVLFLSKNFELQCQSTDFIGNTGDFLKVFSLNQPCKTFSRDLVKIFGSPVFLQDLRDFIEFPCNLTLAQKIGISLRKGDKLSFSDGRVAKKVELHVARPIMQTLKLHVDRVFLLG